MALTLTPEETAPAAPPEDGTLTLTVTLEGLFGRWLAARARAHDQDPAEHAAALLRTYWAHHDLWRHQPASPAPQP